jgi:hypothetical protein
MSKMAEEGELSSPDEIEASKFAAIEFFSCPVVVVYRCVLKYSILVQTFVD